MMNGKNTDFTLAENEEIVRRYHCSTGFGNDGYLSVTTQRVVFNSSGTTILSRRVSSEVKLDSVSGSSTSYGWSFNFLPVIIGIFLIITGLLDQSIVISVVGAICIILGIKKQFTIEVFSSQASGAPISVGKEPFFNAGSSIRFSVASDPTNETEKMIHEIGALIYDLQRFGTAAVEKWKE